ncbi:MAG: bifunctional 5,10-methylenetetrahydrofolate dehydrogenase/5,10-methenyltetrahydrofolate cyclohydrolase [bacterium]
MPTKKTVVILDGQQLADQIKLEIRNKIITNQIHPGLAVILIGDNPASTMYVRLKQKAAEAVGINFNKYICNQDGYPDADEKQVLEMIKFLNNDPKVHGIIVQLPLPKDFDTQKIINAIDPKKDVDGFHPKNKNNKIIPPTVDAILELLKSTGENLINKSTLIIGHSDIFIFGLKKHLQTKLKIKNIKNSQPIPADSHTFDIIIMALGQPLALKKSMVKTGAIVIDVGINKLDGQTVGDVDSQVSQIAGHLSPVPGGVGPLTVACLMRNVYLLAE